MIDQLSEHVLEMMLIEPDDRLRDATFDLLDKLAPPGKPISRSGHLLCQLFEQVAVGLQRLLAEPGVVIDELVGEAVGESELLSAAVRALLKHATAHAMAPLTVLRMKACACALAFCPDTDAHPSLAKNCGIPLLEATADQ